MDAEIREAMAKNEALSDALSSVEAANNARNTFLTSMSHEIRTPINAIIGLDALALRNPDLDAKNREYYEKIGDRAQHLLSIINEILEISRIESGREILHKNEFSLGALLEQIQTQISAQCSEKGLVYASHVQEQTEDSYFGDEMKLKEALTNLLSYAVRLTEEPGTVTMSVEKTTEYENQASLRFCIGCTGTGGKDDIFSGDRAGNIDLSMALTKRIIEMMNGSVSVRSDQDTGTQLTVMVTLRKCDRKEPDHSGEIDPHALSVLVVDDNPIEAEHARMVLEEVGIRAESCSSGQEALHKMEIQHTRQQPYSMVLMDWNMPDMNGMETSAEILRQYERETIIVAMTAYNWEDIREDAQKVGVMNFLEKPLFADNILENLERIARRSNMAIFKEKKKARLEGRRILLAEDVPINAEILMDMLEMENIKADHAENGRIAVELFENSTAGIYSAILMDVRMPLMDGLEAAKAIRAMDREDAKRIPIIALTANSFDEDVQLSMQAGMNAHLNKPVEADRLIRILGELIYQSEEKLTGQ